jgi:CHAD domain-containing protein
MATPDNIELMTRYTEDLFDVVIQNFNQCKEEVNMSSVHDCRVSLRRLMALIDVLSCIHVNEKKSLAIDRKVLKKFQKRFGHARDIHVSEKYITDNIASLCDVRSYLEWLARQTTIIEETLLNDLKKLKLSDYLKIKDNMTQLSLKIASDVSLPKILFNTLDGVFLETIEKIEKLDLHNIDTFHSVRISLKGFRYTLEILNTFDNAYKIALNDLKDLQDYLGEIQDLTVLKNALMDCLPDLKSEFGYDCMLGFINERVSFLSNSFYNQRYAVLKLWEIKI